MAVVLDDIFEVKVGYVANGQQCYNVLHYRPNAEVEAADPYNIQEEFVDSNVGAANGTLVGEYKELLAENVTVNRITAQFIKVQRWRASERVLAVAGTYPGECTAQNVQATLIKRGLFGRRSAVGHVHVGGLSAAAYINGETVPGFRTQFNQFKNTLAGNWTSLATGLVLRPVILNKTLIPGSNPKRYIISGTTLIFTWTQSFFLRTQRTRNVGRGI